MSIFFSLSFTLFGLSAHVIMATVFGEHLATCLSSSFGFESNNCVQHAFFLYVALLKSQLCLYFIPSVQSFPISLLPL